MFRSAIIIFLVNYCAFLFSQAPTFSRAFPGSGKNVALEILNNHPQYFYLLRYNKAVHDIVVERRAKPSAEILNICPLRLDSINASWFNYRLLDHLFFEKEGFVYFFFEKVLNNERHLYIKAIDTNGHAGPFVPLASLATDKSVSDIRFKYNLTEDKKILMVGSQITGNGIVKKTVYLYEPVHRKLVWKKILPIEDEDSGYSESFQCNEQGDLFYVLVKSRVVSFARKFINQAQTTIPVFFYDAVSLVSILSSETTENVQQLLQNVWALHGIVLVPKEEHITANIHYSTENAEGKKRVYFLTEARGNNLQEEIYKQFTPLSDPISSKLTYYDGTDYNQAADKEFHHLGKMNTEGGYYLFSERVDGDLYKEIILRHVNDKTGEITRQALIPRKTIAAMAPVSVQECGEDLSVLLLENKKNQKFDPENFRYQKFAKQQSTRSGILLSYYKRKEEPLKRRVYFSSGLRYYVPLVYQSDQCDFVFYVGEGKNERFATLQLNQAQ